MAVFIDQTNSVNDENQPARLGLAWLGLAGTGIATLTHQRLGTTKAAPPHGAI